MTIGLFIRDGSNVQREITELVIRDGGNVARTISELWIRDTNNVPRLVYNPSGSATFTASVTPATVYGFSSGTGTATSNFATASGTGGVEPYNYLWTLVSYTAASPPTADNPVIDSTFFTQTGIAPNTTESAVWTCHITDNLGNVAISNEVTAYFSDIS